MPLVPIGSGSGRSTPPQLWPLSVEKYPRIGSRKISLEPAARFLGREGLMAMKVSLCGPHSFETSTLLPPAAAAAGAGGWVSVLSSKVDSSAQLGAFAAA